MRGNPRPPGVCHRCGLPRHWACECPQPFDIHSIELNEGEKEQLMYQLMAKLDLIWELEEIGERDPEEAEDLQTATSELCALVACI